MPVNEHSIHYLGLVGVSILKSVSLCIVIIAVLTVFLDLLFYVRRCRVYDFRTLKVFVLLCLLICCIRYAFWLLNV